MVNKMSKERELLARVLESRTFMQGVALRREIEQLLAQPEQTEQFPLPGERLIELWRDGYDAGVRLAQPEHIPDVGNMVTQEPVYWENEKKALLNEIDHLTNRLTQPEQDNTQYLLDQVSRLTAENAMLKEKWSPPKFEPLGLEIMDVCGSEDYREGFKDGALYAEKAHGITE